VLPDIVGMTINDATVLVESLGLKLEVTAGLEAGTVLLFEPAAGTYLARGMTVRVTSGGSGAGGEILGRRHHAQCGGAFCGSDKCHA